MKAGERRERRSYIERIQLSMVQMNTYELLFFSCIGMVIVMTDEERDALLKRLDDEKTIKKVSGKKKP